MLKCINYVIKVAHIRNVMLPDDHHREKLMLECVIAI